MIVMDTDICIEILRGNRGTISRRMSVNDSVAVSFITVSELYYGAYRSKHTDHNLRLVDVFLLTVTILHSDNTVMKTFARLKENLAGTGNTLPDADIYIAASALCNGGRLATGNTAHFERFPGLALENWIRQ